MKKIYLIRHGEKEKTKGDPPLSAKGVEQAKKVGNYFLSTPLDVVYSSPITRAVQTAKLIGEIIGQKVQISKQLAERVNWGDDPDQSLDNFLLMWSKSTNDREWQPPVGDSSYQAGKRLERFIDKLLDKGVDNALLVSHGGIITDFLRNVFDEKLLADKHVKYLSNKDGFLSECSLTQLTFDDSTKKMLLVKLATTEHLL